MLYTAGLDCVKTLDTNAGFQADVFLINIGGSHAIATKSVTAFTEFMLPLQARNQGDAGDLRPPVENFSPHLEKCFGHSSNQLDIV